LISTEEDYEKLIIINEKESFFKEKINIIFINKVELQEEQTKK